MPESATPTSTESARALLRRVELVVARRLDGLLQGERRGRRPGPGSDPSITRAYADGDDVRWVDWRLSARSDDVMVRVPEIEPVLTAWALIDASPSMMFGSEVRTKLDLAREMVVALGLVLARRSDRMGLVVTTGAGLPAVHPPRGDRRGVVNLLAQLDRAVAPPAAPGRTDLAAALTGLSGLARHRGLVTIVSDFPDQPGLERAIGSLARRHEVIAIEIRDQREQDLPALGILPLRDAETGRVVHVDTSDPRFRQRLAQVTTEATARRAAMLARAGARHVTLSPTDDWVSSLARVLRETPRRRLAA